MYQLVLFAHVVGALGLFGAIALEWTSLLRLRRATTVGQAREWAGVIGSVGRINFPSMLAILVSGIYMTVTVWAASGFGAIGWIVASFVAMIALAVIGARLNRQPMATLMQALSAEPSQRDDVSEALSRQVRNPLLWLSAQTRAGIALGIVFCMTVKPDLSGAALAIVIAAALGFALALPALSQGRERANTKEMTA